MSLLRVDQLREILRFLPKYRCAFAYGSGVYQQLDPIESKTHNQSINEPNSWPVKLQQKTKPMIDFIVVTDNSLDWHRRNLQLNYKHYSALKWAGPELITKVQESLGAQCYFNTLVPYRDCVIKYGVIHTEHFVNDLLDWNHLYIAGRLQKPVTLITDDRRDSPNSQLSTINLQDSSDTADEKIQHAMRINRQSAVHASLLLLDEVFTQEQLLLTLVGLSYEGDFRMQVGEDRDKRMKIVRGQFPLLQEIYRPYLAELCSKNILCQSNDGQDQFVQEYSPSCIFHHLNLLPKHVQTRLYVQFNRSGKLFDIDDVLLSLAHSHQCADHVRTAIRSIVRWSSITQSAKGILTAGPGKSTKYAMMKLVKMRQSLKKKGGKKENNNSS